VSAPIQFVVRKRKAKWLVHSNDLERSFSLQREAMLAANESGKNGKPSVVLFQKAKDQFEQIWTYGESAFPLTTSDLTAIPEAQEPTNIGS
jgi:hypothetical protein